MGSSHRSKFVHDSNPSLENIYYFRFFVRWHPESFTLNINLIDCSSLELILNIIIYSIHKVFVWIATLWGTLKFTHNENYTQYATIVYVHLFLFTVHYIIEIYINIMRLSERWNFFSFNFWKHIEHALAKITPKMGIDTLECKRHSRCERKNASAWEKSMVKISACR